MAFRTARAIARLATARYALAGALLSLIAVAAPARAGDQTITVSVGDQQRTCLVHLPPGFDGTRALPLVIALHGSRGTGRGMANMTGFSALADREGFLAAYPDGAVEPRSWNSLYGTLPGGTGVLGDDIDDVAFIRALITTLSRSYHTDASRVFVCGHSSGGYMSYRLAIELSDLIAAAGVVNGSIGIKSLDGRPVPATIPSPARPVSLIHICGARDAAVKFGGAQTPKNLFRSVPGCIRHFVEADRCASNGRETRDEACGVTRTLYTGGKAGTEVELVVVANCGHAWPSDPQGLSATEELWRFFQGHPKSIR